ncbi:LamG-like jellyroll fold domain-containing protein [Salipiger thiooxidans]|uniref:LamG-like jellyroll fold domain-containing protein n=1 Tax=Salipiger thiooxidans TaxID=282683 RepID=UPI001CD50F18|nr:LamG-like jellyroll fold domain-containing protein [Salipiger thiooxidans]MCA0847224.1 hypothetical protein [Salipiger thiooxidans]
MATITVGTSAQLAQALSEVSSGDTIVLADGNYGDMTIATDFPSNVTITAANPLGATFGSLSVTGSNLTFDGVSLTGRLVVSDAQHVAIVNSKLGSWSDVRYSQDVTLKGNDVPGSIQIDTVDTFDLSDNIIGRVPGGINDDLVRIVGNTFNGTIENNTLEDAAPQKYPDGTYTHADGIQFLARGADWPHDIEIRGNLIYDDPSTGDSSLWMQPLAIGGYNILIEENLIMGGTPNTIIVANSSGGIEVLNNTVLPWPGGGGGIIRVNSTTSGVVVDGNVTAGILNQGNATVGDNYVYSISSGAADYFGKILSGDGLDWQDYVPVSGSAIDFGSGYGAQERLLYLLENGWTPVEGGAEKPVVEEPTVEEPTVEEPTVEEPGAEKPDETPIVEEPGVEEPATPTDASVVLASAGMHEINGAGDVIEMAPDAGWDVAEGTIRFSFNADTVSGRSGLVSRDANGDGAHFTSYIQNGTLCVRFQGADGDTTLTFSGIEAGTDYEVTTSFGPDGIILFLNGERVASSGNAASLEGNGQYLQIGANGWASESGSAGFTDIFDGSIGEVTITDTAMTAAELDAMLEGSEEPAVETPTEEPVDDTEVTLVPGMVDMSSAADVIEWAPDHGFSAAEGTISFSFEADTVSGRYGLLSQDAYGNGDHFSAYIENGELNIRFQTDDGESVLKADVAAGTLYDVSIDYGSDGIDLFVDGALVAESDFVADLTASGQYTQVGALGWASADGASGFTNVFDGRIGEVTFGTTTDGVDDSLESGATPPLLDDMLYYLEGGDISKPADVTEFDPGDVLDLTEATIAFTFEADSVWNRGGLVSRDASGNGDHFTSYIENGKLYARFQNDEGSKTLSTSVTEGVEHSVQMTFDGSVVTLAMDGEIVDQANFDANWENNGNFIQVGANGWASRQGTAGFADVFDGSITDVMIFNSAMTPDELSVLDSVDMAAEADMLVLNAELADSSQSLLFWDNILG